MDLESCEWSSDCEWSSNNVENTEFRTNIVHGKLLTNQKFENIQQLQFQLQDFVRNRWD